MKELIDQLFTNVADELSQSSKTLFVYQIGSSALPTAASIADLDVLIIDMTTAGPLHKSDIVKLKRWIFSKAPLKGSFDPASPEDKERVHNAVRRTDLAAYEVEILPVFAVGPIKIAAKSPQSGVLHVCGPLTIEDVQLFFRVFPFHGRAFLALNRCFLGSPLSQVCKKPPISFPDLLDWNSQLLYRGLSSQNLVDKEKCCRKMLLSRYLYEDRPQPYEDVDAFLREKEIPTGTERMDDLLRTVRDLTTRDPQQERHRSRR